MHLRAMTTGDIAGALALWRSCEGVGLNEGDTVEELTLFLERNPGLSFAAFADDKMVGAVLAGHDGRRGFLYHLAVDAGCRRQGLGQALAREALAALRRAGIVKCHVMVFRDNHAGHAFWSTMKWRKREDIATYTGVLE